MKKKMKAIICALVIVALIIVLVEFFVSRFFGMDFGLMPSLDFSNPMDSVPDINPVGRINPFNGMYENPFG